MSSLSSSAWGERLSRMCPRLDVIPPGLLTKVRFVNFGVGRRVSPILLRWRRSDGRQTGAIERHSAPPFRTRTLITRDWRLSINLGVTWGELYNLANDPYEMINLWDDAAAAPIKAELMEMLVQEMTKYANRPPADQPRVTDGGVNAARSCFG